MIRTHCRVCFSRLTAASDDRTAGLCERCRPAPSPVDAPPHAAEPVAPRVMALRPVGRQPRLRCVVCGEITAARVVDCRPNARGFRRRYACPCGRRYTTQERYVPDEVAYALGMARYWASRRRPLAKVTA